MKEGRHSVRKKKHIPQDDKTRIQLSIKDMMKKFEKTEEEEKEKKKEPEEESRVKVLTRRWNERSEKESEKDDGEDGGKMEGWGGRRMKLLDTFRLAEQQPKVKNTDEKIDSRECQTSDSTFIFGNHPRKIIKNGRSEINPTGRRVLSSGLRECQTKGEKK